jgi:hypothetical protein
VGRAVSNDRPYPIRRAGDIPLVFYRSNA